MIDFRTKVVRFAFAASLLCTIAYLPAKAVADCEIWGLLEFRDGLGPDTEGLIRAFTGRNRVDAKLLPWTTEEKAAVKEGFAKVMRLAPGLVERAAAGGPIALYRKTQSPGPNEALGIGTRAYSGYRAIWFARSPKPDQKGRFVCTLIHELAHMADADHKAVRSQDFRGLVEPRLARVRQLLKENGLTWAEAEKAGDERTARGEGLPSLYATDTIQETLAEYISAILIDPGFSPPGEIASYFRRYLHAGQAVDPSVLPYERGIAYLGERRYREAVSSLTEAIASDPSFAQAYYYRARAYQEEGSPAKALLDLDRALALVSPYDFWCCEFIYRRSIAQQALMEYDGALADLTRLLALNPRSIAAYLARANTFRAKGAYEGAIADYSVVTRLEPSNGWVFFLRGMMRVHSQDFDGATEDLRQALRLDGRLQALVAPWLLQAEEGVKKAHN